MLVSEREKNADRTNKKTNPISSTYNGIFSKMCLYSNEENLVSKGKRVLSRIQKEGMFKHFSQI